MPVFILSAFILKEREHLISQLHKKTQNLVRQYFLMLVIDNSLFTYFRHETRFWVQFSFGSAHINLPVTVWKLQWYEIHWTLIHATLSVTLSLYTVYKSENKVVDNIVCYSFLIYAMPTNHTNKCINLLHHNWSKSLLLPISCCRHNWTNV